jgi:hypothetical protein
MLATRVTESVIIHGVPFIVSLNTATSSEGKPTFIGAATISGTIKRAPIYLHINPNGFANHSLIITTPAERPVNRGK